jgi:hypothetical protein
MDHISIIMFAKCTLHAHPGPHAANMPSPPDIHGQAKDSLDHSRAHPSMARKGLSQNLALGGERFLKVKMLKHLVD